MLAHKQRAGNKPGKAAYRNLSDRKTMCCDSLDFQSAWAAIGWRIGNQTRKVLPAPGVLLTSIRP